MRDQELGLRLTLQELGFSEREARVYLAILELGKGTVSEISRKADINRTTGYDILDSLTNRGLVSVSGKEPKQEYVAESPDALRVALERDAARIEENQKVVREIIPLLKSMHRTGDRPHVRFYEGNEGLIRVYEDTLTSRESIRAFATLDDMYRALPNYFPAYFKRRAAKGIPIRAIISRTEMALERITHNKEELRETALVPAEKFSFSPEVNIYDNKVMIASWREKLGIIIESHEIADAMKKIYELAWAEAKRLDAHLSKSETKPFV